MNNISKIIELLAAEQKKYPENSVQHVMINVAGLAMDVVSAFNEHCNKYNIDEVIFCLNEVTANIFTAMKLILTSKQEASKTTKAEQQVRRSTYMN